MHIEYFEYFYKVAKLKSISKVAKNIHISQSALSQQIQKLEDSLGYKLLERSNKGVELTELGEIVLKYSENIIKVYEKMMEELDKGKTRSNTIKIEACPSISHYALPCSLYKIKEEYPYHKYELFTNSSSKIKENILNDLYEIGFVFKNTNEEDLTYHRVGTNKFVLVASQYYDIQKNINIDNLINFPLVTMTCKEELMEKIDENLRKAGHNINELKIVFQLDSIEGVKSSVNRKHGLAFLPYISIKEELYKKQFKTINIDDFIDINMDVYMIIKKRKNINKSIKEFIEMFKVIGEKSFC